MNKIIKLRIFYSYLWAAVFLSFLCAGVCAAQGTQARFFSSPGDLPLMPGLSELADEAVVFDKPGGRIAEASAASSAVSVPEIQDFYARTLPQLGWNPAASGVYVRGGEVLSLRTETQDGYSIVRFTVVPVSR